MAKKLRRWREQYNLTQVDAARLLGVSQPYLSLLERGVRPLRHELRDQLDAVRPRQAAHGTMDDRLRAQLSALGYPGFAHVESVRPAPEPAVTLLHALSQPTVDARVAEALPWLAREYMPTHWTGHGSCNRRSCGTCKTDWGFWSSSQTRLAEPAMQEALDKLDKARLLAEATFCWDEMPIPTRKWMRGHRSPEAEHWNVVSLMRSEGSSDASQSAK